MAKDNLILTQNQWDEILKWIPNTEREEQDERILKYLQEASSAMKAKWPENNKKCDQKKVHKNLSPEMLRYEAIKNADATKRKSMIEEAERFVSSRKIKEFPIELRSAAILSENLAGRKIQLEIQAAQREDEKAKTLLKNKLDMAQSVAWLEDGHEHRTNAYIIARKHKKELLDMINDRKRQRDEAKAARIAEEREHIEQHNNNIREKKVKDRKAKEEQNEYMRKHEVETVLMAKQKRDRIKRENEVIDVLAKVHSEGKSNVKELIKIQENESRLERIRNNAKLGHMAMQRHEAEAKKLVEEQEMIEKARLRNEEILDAIEAKAVEKKEFLKNDRMQDYEQSLVTKAARKSLRIEEEKEYFNNRIMNDVVSYEYTKMKKEMKQKRVKENLDFLKKQAKDIRVQSRQEREGDIAQFNKKIAEDTSDQKFFEYVNDLLEDAESKQRPTKPIHQVTKAYKNRHFIDIKKRTRPHEISNVPIEMEIHKIEGNKGKTKRRIKYEKDEALMANAYRTTKFLNVI